MSVLLTQENVYYSLETPLGKDVLILESFKGEEGFCFLFSFEIQVSAPHVNDHESDNLSFPRLLNSPATLKVNYQQGTRYINGSVSSVTQGATVSRSQDEKDQRWGSVQQKTFYTLTLRPRAWLLTLKKACRIFQNQAALDIIRTILEEARIPYKILTNSAGKRVRPYCVQYNESDFNFISRLMEAEGIYYFFSHTSDSHTLVLCDQKTSYEENLLFPAVRCTDNATAPSPYLPGLMNLRITQRLVPSGYTSTDFNYETPDALMKSSSKTSGIEVDQYLYPGNYKTLEVGQATTDIALGSLETPWEEYTAQTNIPLLEIAKKIKLTHCPRADSEDKFYTLKTIYHEAYYRKEITPPEGAIYKNVLSFFPSTSPYFPPQISVAPKIPGAQTAIVTGKEGEEIWTDAYGRVLVKFHWDLSDTKSEQTSCWIRVAQGWAGNTWGLLFTPRIGQEVVVSFLNGNPDDPLITGCVYNANNRPPYLPEEPTKSTLRTNSSKGGGGFNELRFEDKKGDEEVYMHAEKDLNVDILNGNRTTTLEGATDQGGNDTLLLKKGNRTKTLQKGNETVTLKEGDRSVSLEKGNDSLTLNQGNRSVSLKNGNLDTQVTGNSTLKISGDYTLEIGGNLTLKVTGALSIESETSCTVSAKTSYSLKCSQFSTEADSMMQVKSPLFTVSAENLFSLKTGVFMAKATSGVTMQAEAISLEGQAIVLG